MQKAASRKRNLEVKSAPARRVLSRELLQNGDRLIIDHNGQEYTLRITQNGKLILTK